MPKRIITKGGHIRQIECLKTRLGEVGEGRKEDSRSDRGLQFSLDVDDVIVAVGESPEFSGLTLSLKLKQDRVVVDRTATPARRSSPEGM